MSIQVWSALILLFHVKCTIASEQRCPAVDNPDVKYFDIRIPKLDVPEETTKYVCQMFKVPSEETYHAIAFEPLVDNHHVMHHMLMFGCDFDAEDTDPHTCSGEDGRCRSWLAQWTMGVDGQVCTYPDTGIRFGKDSYRYLSLQIHWNNNQKLANQTDNSGMRIYYTTQLRKYDAGNVQIGQQYLDIPPNSVHNETGGCSGTCTSGLLPHPVYLTRTYIHMHYLGSQGLMEVVRDGRVRQRVAYDPVYDYKISPIHVHSPPIEVLPGDEIRLTCTFDSKTGDKFRNNSIYFGEGSDAEMCYAFVTYFPNVKNFDQCLQFDKYDVNCVTPDKPFMGGCIFSEFQKQLLEEDSLLVDISKSCNQRSQHCGGECSEHVKVLVDHPCMQGRLGSYSERVYLQRNKLWPKVSSIVEKCSHKDI